MRSQRKSVKALKKFQRTVKGKRVAARTRRKYKMPGRYRS